MKRITHWKNGHAFGNGEKMEDLMDRLAQYEDALTISGNEVLSPEEAARQKKYNKAEQWLDDMANPLESIKVSAALDSEIRKLNYRKENKPDTVSVLDYTIIAALMQALNK